MNGLSKAMTMKSAIVMIALAVLATGLATSAVDPVTAHAQPVQPEVGPILAAQPNVPTGLKLIWQDERVRLVTWDSVPSADSYNLSLCYGTTNTPSNCQVSTAYTSTSIYVFDVEHVAVQAVNSSGVSAWSQYVRVARQPPEPPTDVRVINSRIGWDSSNGAESYSVELCRQSACDVIDNIACCTYTPSNLTSIEYVRVRAANGAGRSDWSDATYVQTIVPLPNAPTGVSISSGRVTWNSVSGAEWYNIILDRRNGGSVISNIPCCSYTLLPSNTSDATHVSIQAANSTATSPYSAKVSIPAALQKPPTPSGVRFDSGRVIWNAVSGADSYWVSLCTQLGCVVEVDRSCCSYTVRDRDLEDLTHVRVAAVNSAGQSAWSGDAPVPRTIGKPDAPSGVAFSSGRASWNPVPNADSYELLLCVTHGGAPQCPQQPRASCCSYTISDRSITHFLVRAVNSAGEGLWSDPVYLPVQTPGTPTSARLRDSGQVTWNSVSGADSYDVALCTTAGCVVHNNISCCRYTPSDLRDVTHIKIRAVNSAGRGDWSRNVDVVSAPPEPVRNLEFRYLDPDTSAPTEEPTRRFEITWDPPSGQSSVSGYVVTLSRPAVAHHAAWSKSYNHASNSFRRRHTGQAGTVYTVTVAARNQSGPGLTQTVRIPTSNETKPAIPSVPQNLKLQLSGSASIAMTWDQPSHVGSEPITSYRQTTLRSSIVDSSQGSWSSSHNSTSRRTTFEGRPCQTYAVELRAENDAGLSLPATQTITTKCPSQPVYINDIEDDREVRENISWWDEGLCQSGTPVNCWKHRHTGHWQRNSYFETVSGEMSLTRRAYANDTWGTNGFYVVSINPKERQRVAWRFPDVDRGSYNVRVYIPDPNDENEDSTSIQPGAIVRYRVYVNGNYIGATRVDQSKYRHTGGRWVSVRNVDVPDNANVRVYVSSYWPDDTRSDSYAATPSGPQEWHRNLAADAVMLYPIGDVSPDWSALGSYYRNAQSWCAVDVLAKLFLDPLWDILRDVAIDKLKTALLAAAGAVFTVATGGAGAPLAAALVVSRIGLGINVALQIGRLVSAIQRVLVQVKKITDRIGDIQSIRTAASELAKVGTIVANPDQTNQEIADLQSLCAHEPVWENYYGEQNIWDGLQAQFLRLIGWIADRLSGLFS